MVMHYDQLAVTAHEVRGLVGNQFPEWATLPIAIEERVSDRHVLKLMRAMLSVGVMEHGTVTGGDTGTPQGGVISPLLANIYLNRVDRAWVDVGRGVVVRYADDLVRHEALFDRVEVKGLRRWPVAAGCLKLGAA